MTRIYTDQALSPNTQLDLDTRPSHHLANVLRAKNGDAIVLFNGDGQDWHAEICHVSKKTVRVAIRQATPNNTESPLATHLGIVVSKGDRMDFVVQKSTELGVTAITPLISKRCEVRLNPQRWEKKQTHWQNIMISACEQSGRSRLPLLHEQQSLDDWLVSRKEELKLVLHPHRNAPESQIESQHPVNSVALLVGPEGGFAELEVDQAEKQDFKTWQLGPRILRTETAPLTALSILQHRWGDFS